MDPVKDTLKKIRDTIHLYTMTDPGDMVIAAVSGGPDSVCLLDALHQLSKDLEISLVVAHYNHGLREKEDEAETRLVHDMAVSLNLPFETGKADHLRGQDSSVEERAREARYGFLEGVRDKHMAGKIALGHTLNDQAETVLMRIIRGSGPPGLAGIPPVRGKGIIRPLIGVKREEIMDYLKARRLPYAFDSSNTDKRYLRNRIRLELLPMMQDYEPQVIDKLCRLADIIREEDLFIESMASDWVDKEGRPDAEGSISIPLSSFVSLPGPLRNRVARHILKRIGRSLRKIGYDHIQAVLGLADGGESQSMITLPNGLRVRKVYNSLEFASGPGQEFHEYSYLIESPGIYYMEAIDRTILLEETDIKGDGFKEGLGDTAHLDAAKVQYPLIVRNFRPGDRIIPLGMKGHKKVKDLFIDLKIPSDIRAMTPILTSRDCPVWICGYRIDDRFKVTPSTERVLKVTVKTTGSELHN
jgi:tRNA(Ile)-lysidine synthase